jgi:hypothetical protein
MYKGEYHMINVSFKAASSIKVSTVVARDVESGKRISIARDTKLTASQNAEAAARALCTKLNISAAFAVAGSEEDDFVFVPVTNANTVVIESVEVLDIAAE